MKLYNIPVLCFIFMNIFYMIFSESIEFLTENENIDEVESDIDKNEHCDFIVSEGICLKDKIIAKNSQNKDLIGHYNFDDQKAFDQSGESNHAKGQFQSTVSFNGQGHSAYFNGNDFLEIPHNKNFRSKSFSFTFWLFMIQPEDQNQKGLRWCPILQKGIDDNYEKTYFRSPALFFDRKDRYLKLLITTSDNSNQPLGEGIVSNARMNIQRWNHIAIVREDKKVKLYVNGILDAINSTIGQTVTNNMPLYVGQTPWHQEDCNVQSLIDDLRIYKRALKDQEIEAEAAPALGGIEPNFIQLGCLNCPLKQAAKACITGYHLCTSIELHSGGYQVARAMGWLNWKSTVWSHGILKKEEQSTKKVSNLPQYGLGLCCLDLK